MNRRLLLLLLAVPMLALVACGGDAAPDVLTAPKNVAAAAAHGIVTVSWQYDGATPDGFEVWRADADGGDAALLDTVAAADRSYLDRTPDLSVAYRYRVVSLGDDEELESALTSAVTASPGIALSVGTYRWQTNLTAYTSFGLYWFLDTSVLPSVPLEVTIQGPAGWNAGAPFPGELSKTTLSGQWYVPVDTSVPAVVGEYKFALSLPGAAEPLHTATYNLTSLDMQGLLQPSASFTESELQAGWNDVAQSDYYSVAIYQGLYTQLVKFWIGQDTVLADSSVAYEPGDYAVLVRGYAQDPLPTGRQVPLERHNTVGWLIWPVTLD